MSGFTTFVGNLLQVLGTKRVRLPNALIQIVIPILLRDKALDRVFDKSRSMRETSINEQRITHNYRGDRRT